MAHTRCFLSVSSIVFVVSCLLITAGIIGITMGPHILQNKINNQLPLTADSTQLDAWSTPPVPIYFQIWLWECINVADVLKGVQPMLVQRGPFTYLEHRSKTGIYFNENDTVTYRQPIGYTFLRDMSWNNEDVKITMVNTPIVTIISLVRSLPKWEQEVFDFVSKNFFNESLFVQRTARDWIWGYEDPLLKKAKELPILDVIIPDDHFGYFYGKNTTDDGLYTVFTGGDKIDQLNNINKWNGVSSLTFWNSSWANQINGTDGSWFAPLFGKNLQTQRLYLFSTDVCRSLYAKFERHSSVLDIPTEIFSIPSEVFLNGTLNPDNAAFGTADSGVLNVSVCRQGAPVFISMPHLLYAAQQYQNGVFGIAPNADIHRTIIEVEPHTGLVLNAQKRLQINVYIKSDPYIADLQNVAEFILPAIWINESTTIDQKSANDLNNQILRYFTIVRWVSIVLIPLGVIIIIITIVLVTKRRRNTKDETTPLLHPESNNLNSSHKDY